MPRRAPWVAVTTEEYDDTNGDLVEVQTGWIKGVVEYQGCGSHRAKWSTPEDFKLVLAAPQVLDTAILAVNTLGILVQLMGDDILRHLMPGEDWKQVKQVITDGDEVLKPFIK